QHLAAVAGVADADGTVDREPDVLIADQRRLARVDPDTNAQIDVVRPVVLGERALGCHGRVRGLLRAAEGDEERVAVCVELSPRGLRPGGAHQLLVLAHDASVTVTKLAKPRRRSLDVGAET